MNLMYFKNLRGDRDGGTTGLLSSSRRATAGIGDGGGASSGGPSYGGVRGLGVGAGGGANSRSWFNAGVSGGVSSLTRAPGPGSGGPAPLGTAAAASATGAGAGGAGLTSSSTEMQHLRTHPLGLFDLPRHGTDNGGGGFDDPDRGSALSRSSAVGGGGGGGSSANNRWGHGGGLDRLDPSCVSGGGGGGSGGTSRADYRYTRVDRQQQRMVDSAIDSAALAGGSRSVRSGLYAGEHQFTGEVCLSVSGLSGNARASGPSASGGGGGTVVSGRTGKQVSFGRHSPDIGGASGNSGTMERERSRESSSDKRSRSSASGGQGGGNLSSIGGGIGGVSSNKENSESRSTFPRSSIVASKRPSPERLLAAEPRDTVSRRPSSRDDSADGRRRRPTSANMTAETSLSLPDSRHRGGSGRRSNDPRDVNRISNNDPTFDELIDPKDLNLNDIARDCFIIPVHLVNRFLPLGVTLPQTGRASMSVVEVDDPQLIILLHFMTPFMAIQPVFESPLARPASLQGNMASQLLIDLLRDRPGAHGMLLVSIEQDVDYPYINYGVANRQQTNGEEWQQTARLASLERFEPQNLRYFSDHLVDVYEEAATIARPPLQPACRRPLSNKTGYIVCVYKVFDGDDGEKFERNWLYWTGARILYQCVPRCVGLRRITLHKSVSAGDKLYTLMCECSSFMDHLQEAAYIAPALRARLCGYWSIYRVADVY